MKRILITGGAGFIGSHTVDLLLANDYEVVVFDNLSSGKLANLNLFHPNLQMIQGDILDSARLLAEMSRCDAVLHLAALPSVPFSIENPVQSFHVNMRGFLSVLQVIRELTKPIRLVYASSAAVYGALKELPCRDDIPLLAKPLSPYALEKVHNEDYADLFGRLYGSTSLGLRYFNVYGKRQDPSSVYSGVISKFLKCYKENEPLKIFGDGEQSRDFIHVSDIARANLLALQSDQVGVLNIATGVPETLNNMVQYIEQAGKNPAEIEWAPAREGDILHSFADVQSAEKAIKFKFKISLKDGIGEWF